MPMSYQKGGETFFASKMHTRGKRRVSVGSAQLQANATGWRRIAPFVNCMKLFKSTLLHHRCKFGCLMHILYPGSGDFGQKRDERS